MRRKNFSACCRDLRRTWCPGSCTIPRRRKRTPGSIDRQESSSARPLDNTHTHTHRMLDGILASIDDSSIFNKKTTQNFRLNDSIWKYMKSTLSLRNTRTLCRTVSFIRYFTFKLHLFLVLGVVLIVNIGMVEKGHLTLWKSHVGLAHWTGAQMTTLSWHVHSRHDCGRHDDLSCWGKRKNGRTIVKNMGKYHHYTRWTSIDITSNGSSEHFNQSISNLLKCI